MTLHDALLEAHAPPTWDGHINEAGLLVIQDFEGWGSTYDAKGVRITPSHPDIDEVEGLALLLQEVQNSENAIRRIVKAPLNENQFSSLCSFVYNVGSGNFYRSTMRQRLSRLDYEGASDEFPKWRKSAGRVLPGLVRRRRVEQALFNS